MGGHFKPGELEEPSGHVSKISDGGAVSGDWRRGLPKLRSSQPEDVKDINNEDRIWVPESSLIVYQNEHEIFLLERWRRKP